MLCARTAFPSQRPSITAALPSLSLAHPAATAAAAAIMSSSTLLDLEQVPSHQFRKLGAVAILPSLDAVASGVHYDDSATATSAALRAGRAKSLLAVGSHYGLLFVVAPSLASAPHTHGLYVARSHDVLQLIDEDRAAQEEEQRDRTEERSAKQADVPLSDKVFTFVPVQVSQKDESCRAGCARRLRGQ